MAYRTCGFVKFSKFWTDERAANRKRKERKCDICRLWNYKKLIKVVSELWKLQIRKTFLYEAWLEHTCTTKKSWIWALWYESHIRGTRYMILSNKKCTLFVSIEIFELQAASHHCLNLSSCLPMNLRASFLAVFSV